MFMYLIHFSDQLPEAFYTRLLKNFTNIDDCVLHIYANVVAMLKSGWSHKRIAFVLEPNQVMDSICLLVKEWMDFGLHVQSELIVAEMINNPKNKVNESFY